MVKNRKGIKRIIGEKEKRSERTRNSHFFYSPIYPLDFFNDEFFEIAIKETTRGFLEEN